MSGALHLTVEELRRVLGGEIQKGKNGPYLVCPGPGHSVQDRSLSVTPSSKNEDGFVVTSFSDKDDWQRCKAHVRERLRLPPFEPKANGSHRPAKRREVKSYDYTSDAGELLFQTVRYEPKGFSQRRPDGKGGWIWNLDGVERTIYRLPEINEAIALEKPVFVVEGERDADTLSALGQPATTNPQGAGKWLDQYSTVFAGAVVYVIPDQDEPGRKHAAQVAQSLTNAGATVRVLDLPHGKDVSDWLATGSMDQLNQLAEAAPVWSPSSKPDQTGSALIRSSAQFIEGFVPPDYLVDGILQRRFVYSLTGKTGSGKTAILTFMAASTGLGRPIGVNEVERGRVLYFAGENPDDVRMRWIALSQQMDFHVDSIDVHFIPGAFKISELLERIRTEVRALGGVILVIVDTSAAYFEGNDENSNKEQGDHARRFRSLVEVDGGPCVVVACHPTKNAAEDNLLPRGGGAFVAEMDGNLTAQKEGVAVEMHWQGKFRGPDFAPISFMLRTVTHERLKDSKGRLIPTVVAGHLSEAGQDELAAVARTNENQLLKVLAENEGASLADLARLLGWKMGNGQPHKMMVSRTLKKLKRHKLITAEGDDRATLTPKGKKAIEAQ